MGFQVRAFSRIFARASSNETGVPSGQLQRIIRSAARCRYFTSEATTGILASQALIGGAGGPSLIDRKNRIHIDMTNPRQKASSMLLQENDRAIVTEWRFAPGAETGWHCHTYDYVFVCLTGGKLVAETSTGNIETELQFGQAYARPVCVEHNIVNPGDNEFVFVEVEIK